MIFHLIVECPSSVRRKGKSLPVSHSATTFKGVGIKSNALTKLAESLKQSLDNNVSYRYEEHLDVETALTEEITKKQKDPNQFFDLFVMQTRSDMSEVEALFYYIRCAFAHGAFGVEKSGRQSTYYLESEKDGKLKARFRLSRKTLEQLFQFAKTTCDKALISEQFEEEEHEK